MAKEFKIYFSKLTKFLLLVALAFFLTNVKVTKVFAQSPNEMSGYAWSDSIGWISLNCSNTGTCGNVNYGLSINDSDGTVSGYAWSDNVGWISANSLDVSGCPSGICVPRLQYGTATGWLKVLSSGTGGWDGWISLRGSGYGVTYNGTSFSGYAWGSDVVGWVDFSQVVSVRNPGPLPIIELHFINLLDKMKNSTGNFLTMLKVTDLLEGVKADVRK